MNRVASKKGFTLIELMLAMAFLSILLLAVAMTIIQIGVTYNRGITLKEVNQSARNLNDELSRSLSRAAAFDLSTNYVTNNAGGRLCMGQDSYIWNTGTAIQADDDELTGYDPLSSKADQTIRFIKVSDPAAIYCATNNGALVYSNVRAAEAESAVNLLDAGDRELTLHTFDITSGANANDDLTGQQLYTLTFRIGTGNAQALTEDLSSCRPPSDPLSDFTYCTIQEFRLVLRATGQVN